MPNVRTKLWMTASRTKNPRHKMYMYMWVVVMTIHSLYVMEGGPLQTWC